MEVFILFHLCILFAFNVNFNCGQFFSLFFFIFNLCMCRMAIHFMRFCCMNTRRLLMLWDKTKFEAKKTHFFFFFFEILLLDNNCTQIKQKHCPRNPEHIERKQKQKTKNKIRLHNKISVQYRLLCVMRIYVWWKRIRLRL